MVTEWTKRMIATYNNYLHNACGVCPGNHTVEYSHGDLYLDGIKRDKSTTELIRTNAKRNKKAGYQVVYSSVYNSFVLSESE